VLGVIAVLAALACAAGFVIQFVYYRRRASAAHKKGDPLQKSLLGADELEMGSLGKAGDGMPVMVGVPAVYSVLARAIALVRTGLLYRLMLYPTPHTMPYYTQSSPPPHYRCPPPRPGSDSLRLFAHR
jgi:hypothetical protein